MEDVILSPAFAVLLAIVGSYLFLIISREFFSWYLKLGEMNEKIKTIDERLADIEVLLEKLPSKLKTDNELAQLPPTPGLKEQDSQFPLQH